MTLVADSSLVIAAFVDSGPDGTWADHLLAAEDLAAPHLMPAEAANILRRSALAGDISADTASIAYADLLSLRVELFAYDPFASRVWELRENVTAYDGWYVALAESLSATLATLDVRLSRASGPRCAFVTPPSTEPSDPCLARAGADHSGLTARRRTCPRTRLATTQWVRTVSRS